MLRKYLIAGLLIWLPLAITLWVLDFIVTTMDRTLMVLPASLHPDQVLGVHVPGLGLVMSVIILLVTGALAANIIGARMFSWWESVLVKIPIVRPIYSSVKQVSDTLFASKGQSFRKVVLIEFPNRGQWTFGFIVGAPGPAIERETARRPDHRLRADRAQPDVGLRADGAACPKSRNSTSPSTTRSSSTCRWAWWRRPRALRGPPSPPKGPAFRVDPSGLRADAFPFKLAAMQSPLCARFAIAVQRGRVASFARALANARNR